MAVFQKLEGKTTTLTSGMAEAGGGGGADFK